MDSNSEIDLEAGEQLQSHISTVEAMSTADTSKEEDQDYFKTLVQTAMTDDSKLTYGYLSFNVLHKLVLLKHQRKLSLHVRDIVRNKTCNDDKIKQIDDDLHNYRML